MTETEKKSTEKRKIIIEMIIFSQISIFVPLILFGSLGIWLYKSYHKVYFLLIFVGIAFVVTNFLLLKKVSVFNKRIKNCFDKEKK